MDIKINGLAALQQALETLPTKVEGNMLRGALRAGAKVIATEAQRTSAFADRTGELRKSIRVSARLRGGKATASIKAGGKKAWYAHIVERGAKPHLIKPKQRKSLFLAGVLREVVHHPGATARPYMRPAMDGQAQAAVEAAASYLRGRLTKQGIDIPDQGNDPET